jgi:hypothetical protein
LLARLPEPGKIAVLAGRCCKVRRVPYLATLAARRWNPAIEHFFDRRAVRRQTRPNRPSCGKSFARGEAGQISPLYFHKTKIPSKSSSSF